MKHVCAASAPGRYAVQESLPEPSPKNDLFKGRPIVLFPIFATSGIAYDSVVAALAKGNLLNRIVDSALLFIRNSSETTKYTYIVD